MTSRPKLGNIRLDLLTTVDLQAFFNSFTDTKLSPKSIKNMHAALRAALTEAVRWGMIQRNPAVGVKLPRAKPVKPPVILPFHDIRNLIEKLPDPAKAIVTLIVFGSMRVGEVLALRWNDILRDRIVVDERLWEGDLDSPKTINGNREIPFDRQGVIQTTLTRIWKDEKRKHRQPTDFVFATRTGTATERRNVLRHVKKAAKELKLPKEIDFRSFRTTHASLMGRAGARAEVIRDNMGHSDVDVTQNIYGKSWWEERVDAVSAAVGLFMATTEPNKKSEAESADAQDDRGMLFTQSAQELQLEPNWSPSTDNSAGDVSFLVLSC